MKNKNYISLICGILLSLFPVISFAQNNKVIFRDVTKKAGLDFKYTFGDYHYENIVESSGSGVTVFDYNNDGLMDVYMMNGTYLYGVSDNGGIGFKNTRDKLYKNNGNGTFTDVSAKAGVDDTTWSMAAGAIDSDNEGDGDLT